MEASAQGDQPVKQEMRITTEEETLHQLINLIKEAQFKDQRRLTNIKDKVGFTVGVVFSWITIYIVAKFPYLMPYWYSVWTIILLIIRFIMYSKVRWHYFMLDMCYMGQLFNLVYLFAPDVSGGGYVRNQSWFFAVIFSFSNGPMAWGVVLWRNSLVFHSLDKITSAFIHILPMLLTYCLRWYPSSYEISAYYASPLSSDKIHVWTQLTNMVVFPIALYILWQILYLVKTERKEFRVSSQIAVADDDKIMTSFKWLSSSSNSSAINKFVRRFPPQYRLSAFVGAQFVFTVMTMIPAMLFYHYQWLHLSFILILVLICTWNGASFYFDVFSVKYADELNKQQQEAT